MRPLLQIVSIAPTGEEELHWQLPDLAVARRMAAFVVARVVPADHVVKIRGVIEVVEVRTVEIDIPIEKVKL